MTSSSSSRSLNHDVFLSFKGKDTHKTFVDHLYTALVQQGIYTYKDDETLPRGESIGPSLLKAIEESQICVIVFSKNYADSSWCLDELVYIMKCKDTRGLKVMPVFYDVDPSEVRKQKDKYGEAFAKHDRSENNDKVDSWRKALVDVGNLSGWELKHIANGHESKCIKEIVDTISDRLHPVISSANENLIGVETRVKDLISKLQIWSGGVLMIGVWGVGGCGKTTLASSVYYDISSKFDGCCFVENIREESKNKFGLEKLQEKVISSVLKQKQVEVGRVEEGRRRMYSRFCDRKVLIVLDDVDHLDQLYALAGSQDWFGDGSRIIITTRDNHLLYAHKVNVVHNISLLNDDEGIQLFRKHAPQDYRPIKGYEFLSKEVVSYAKGLPLALKVLGSFLCDKDINEWLSTLARLKDIPEADIVEKLKISFDGLKPIEKELFLDISCFFRGVKKKNAMEILDACGLHSVIGVKVLVEKALITISDGKFDMHDLIQEMGHYIVRGKHPKNPDRHSRVWKMEDVLNICTMDAKTQLDKIKAIRFIPHTYDPLPRHLEVVANMRKLRWIHWRGLHITPLPTNFPQRELCCLILSGIVQKQLWEGYKYLPNLRMIKLHGLENLIMTPDFNGLPNLERFMVYGSPFLETIHPSIGCLQRLVCVILQGCVNLKMFPRITRLKKLECLVISGCTKLFKPSEVLNSMEKLNRLHVGKSGKEIASYRRYCTNIFATCWAYGCRTLRGDTNFMKLPQEPIDVECCFKESPLPYDNLNHIGLQCFHKSLRKLILNNCNLGDEEIGSDVWKLSNVQELHLARNNFSRLNFGVLQLPRLKWLDVSQCENLEELVELPSSLAVLIADFCILLESVSDISKCKWLCKVSLIGKNKLCGDILLDSMLQGNAIEDHLMSTALENYVPKGFTHRLVKVKKLTLKLPHNWYADSCGFLICFIRQRECPRITISIKQELEKDRLSELEPEEPTSIFTGITYVGYVSLSSLRQSTWLNSSCNLISFSVVSEYKSLFGVKLVARQTKCDWVRTTDVATDFSEYWDEELEYGNTFMIQHDSKSSVKIIWNPCLRFPL